MPNPQMLDLLIRTRASPSVKAIRWRSFLSGESLPLTSTASGMAFASSSDSWFDSHHTIHGSELLFTIAATRLTRSFTESRFLRCKLVALISGISNKSPSSKADLVSVSTLCVTIFSGGKSYPSFEYPKSLGFETHAAHDATHCQKGLTAWPFNRQSPV